MSLKAFHIVFIACSSIFAFGMGVWFIRFYYTTGELSQLLGACLAFLSGVALIIYGKYFLRKLQNVRFL